MLTESAYVTGLAAYTLAGLLAVWGIHRWFLRRLALWLRLLVVLPLLALLLTPAYTAPGSETMAPALVVAGFQLMIAGAEGARYALQPLLAMSGIAVALALLLGIGLRLLRRGR